MPLSAKLASSLDRVAQVLPRPLRFSLRAAFDLALAQPRLLLVYQMGKVGSRSVAKSLKSAGLWPLHVHSLGGQTPAIRADYRKRNAPYPYHMYLEGLLRGCLSLGLGRQRIKVVTLVRDPIAREISRAYQLAEWDGGSTDDAAAMAARLAERLSDPGALDDCYSWFDDEIKERLGVDVLAEDFDRARGYARLAGERADVLVLKLEKLDALWPVIGAFVGREVVPKMVNVRSAAANGATYGRVRSTLSWPRDHVARLYDNPWVRHFYTADEVAGFIERWSAPAAHGPETLEAEQALRKSA